MTTTSAQILMRELRKAGIRLEAQGDRIRFAPKSAITDELRNRMLAHKRELLAIIRSGAKISPAKPSQLITRSKSHQPPHPFQPPAIFGRVGYLVANIALYLFCVSLIIFNGESLSGEASSKAMSIYALYFTLGAGLCWCRLLHIGWNPFLSLIFAAPIIFMIFPAYDIVAGIFDLFDVMIVPNLYHAYLLVGVAFGVSGIFGILCQVLPKNYAKIKQLDLSGKIVAGIFCVLGLIIIIRMLSLMA